MKDQLQTIREAIDELHGSLPEKEAALTAVAQLEAMVGEPVAYLYASIAGPVVLHRLQQIGHAKPLYFQDQLENDLRAQTKYPDAHSCVPLYAAPVAQQPQAEPITEAAIDAYLDDYEMRGETEDGRDACYAPSEGEKFLIKDAIMGLLAEAPLQQPQAEAVPSDTERLNWIEREYVQVDTFSMPTGAGDADVGWTFKEWYEGEREPRLIYRHYKDDLRAAIDAAIAAAKKEAGHE